MHQMSAHDDESGELPAECIPDNAFDAVGEGKEAPNSHGDRAVPHGPLTQEKLQRIRKGIVDMKAAQEAAAAEEESAYRLPMYSHTEVVNRLSRIERQKDLDSLRAALREMQTGRSWRALTPQPKNYSDTLDRLGKRYPHFSAVIEMLRASMRLNALDKYPVVDLGTNILLLGSPGCGKSSFLFDLGESLGTKFLSFSCASMSMAGDLSGLSAGWSSGHAGAVFEALVQQGCANPIILLDEMDKVQTDGSQPFMSALYGLLEKNNARKFKDEYIGVSIDASRINWFASANDLSSLSAPICDRFKVIKVSAPSSDDLRQILPQIYKEQVHHRRLQKVFSTKLPSEVTEVMLHRDLSIRRYRSLIEEAMANASVRAGQGVLTLKPEDVPVDNQLQEKGGKIGFIH